MFWRLVWSRAINDDETMNEDGIECGDSEWVLHVCLLIEYYC